MTIITETKVQLINEIYYSQRGIDDAETILTPALYMYGANIEELYGTTTIIDGLEFASIDVLRNEIKEERERSRRISINHDKEDYFDDISPWMLSDKEEEGLIVCKEGVFEWRWDKEEYEFIGKFHRTHRQKTVTILEDIGVTIRTSNICLESGESFDLGGEYVIYDNEMSPIVMLIIHYKRFIPFAIPFVSQKMRTHYRDLIVVDYSK
ncbi:hypothetical protein [Cytobacillus horneckiae]|uniref:hypothetical protein n=1 Tax=Cytobacillus horneckiae TaxID=549687 RepID=UPI002DBF151C|nr:hypothetical protein [Cytobacillus horneckiae]MEC1157840.1 hypothetical protein [Cytobacillus horneckiae]MED2940734.1 hypothetical protein [Cytobacillus horneckiae]